MFDTKKPTTVPVPITLLTEASRIMGDLLADSEHPTNSPHGCLYAGYAKKLMTDIALALSTPSALAKRTKDARLHYRQNREVYASTGVTENEFIRDQINGWELKGKVHLSKEDKQNYEQHSFEMYCKYDRPYHHFSEIEFHNTYNTDDSESHNS